MKCFQIRLGKQPDDCTGKSLYASIILILSGKREQIPILLIGNERRISVWNIKADHRESGSHCLHQGKTEALAEGSGNISRIPRIHMRHILLSHEPDVRFCLLIGNQLPQFLLQSPLAIYIKSQITDVPSGKCHSPDQKINMLFCRKAGSGAQRMQSSLFLRHL